MLEYTRDGVSVGPKENKKFESYTQISMLTEIGGLSVLTFATS